MMPRLLPSASPVWLFLLLLMAVAVAGISTQAAEPPAILDTGTENPESAGRSLAAELRGQRPAGSFTNSGVLRIRDAAGRRREVPLTITCQVEQSGAWHVQYVARPGGASNQALTVRHATGAAPGYEVARSGDGGLAEPPRAVPPGQSFEPFAGSDFWLADLGLEFLHWPDQRLVGRELSNGRMCLVLESTNPGTAGYARVRSWVDAEYHGLLRAEAYDAQRRLLKEFSTGSFRQITRSDGRELWVLKDLRMRDQVNDTRTDLLYDLPPQ